MYGAILGDMIGAPYEFDRGNKTKDFTLFTGGSNFTDDTVMTIAVAEALLNAEGKGEAEVKALIIESMQKWGRKYPNAGYGGRFIGWLWEADPKPYGSYGNGSAMRVAAAEWLYDTIERTREMARLTAEVTHDHPEGIKGAEATASAIFLARTGSGKEEIRRYIVREFGYDLSRTCDEIRPAYRHVESCQETVPEAITAFLEGNGLEDVIRTAVSLGGDCDTLTCIAGSIAEAFYGVPTGLEAECKARLPEEMLEVLRRFDIARGKAGKHGDTDPDGNGRIENAIKNFHENQSRETLITVLEAIRQRSHEDGYFMIPVIPPEAMIKMFDIEYIKVGNTITCEEDMRFKLHHIQLKDGKQWLVAFTSQAEFEKGAAVSTISNPISETLKGCRNMPEEGIFINPWGGRPFFLHKALIGLILDADIPEI